MNWKEKARQLKINIPAIFLALHKKDTPVLAKIFAGVTVVYALSPIDFVPDFIPFFGYLDDLLILPVLVALTLRFIPKEQFEICQKEAEGMWENGKPQKWYYSIPIVLIWAVIVWLIVKVIV